ncbi:hypothetical protein AOLI_G00116640 [Acnodon oligacanthus]
MRLEDVQDASLEVRRKRRERRTEGKRKERLTSGSALDELVGFVNRAGRFSQQLFRLTCEHLTSRRSLSPPTLAVGQGQG